MKGSEYFTLRIISHDEAQECARRLVNSHFHQEPHARISIPARPDHDDDLLIMAYIHQQREATPAVAETHRNAPGDISLVSGATSDPTAVESN